MKNVILLSIVIIVCSCINASEKKTTIKASNQERTIENKDSLNNNQYIKVHTFKDKEGNVLGNMYVNLIKENIFTSLVITGETELDTLYFIDQYNFYNKKGIDFKVNKDNFYGYKIELKKNDYFVLVYLQNNGLNISDPVTIEWNYSDEIFEIMKTP